jgi:hypothetical protein
MKMGVVCGCCGLLFQKVRSRCLRSLPLRLVTKQGNSPLFFNSGFFDFKFFFRLAIKIQKPLDWETSYKAGVLLILILLLRRNWSD